LDIGRAASGDKHAQALINRHLHEPQNADILEMYEDAAKWAAEEGLDLEEEDSGTAEGGEKKQDRGTGEQVNR